MGIHDGHRKRLKDRFLTHGLDNFDDLNALELLLCYALPRQDTNPIAHALLERFGSLDAVLEASSDELQKVSGIGENAAALLRLIPAVSRRYMLQKTPPGEVIASVTQAGRYLIPYFMYEREEVVYALLLDARRRPICCTEIARGTVDAADISPRRLATLCLEKNASRVLLAHNHLSGNTSPSVEDEHTTRLLAEALRLVGIPLADHLIVAGYNYTSMKESGLIP